MSLFQIILLVWLACAMLVIVAGLRISTRPVSERSLKVRDSGSTTHSRSRSVLGGSVSSVRSPASRRR